MFAPAFASIWKHSVSPYIAAYIAAVYPFYGHGVRGKAVSVVRSNGGPEKVSLNLILHVERKAMVNKISHHRCAAMNGSHHGQ